jgi:plastocyanin
MLVAATVAALAAAPPALAANADVRAVDDASGVNNVWDPASVRVNVGDTVTWRFDGSTLAHNVKATSANWTVDTPGQVGGNPYTFQFGAEGTYTYVCEFHESSMRGTVTVGSPPPPPPPPPGEQPYVNDQPAPTVFETTDRRRPRLSRVAASGLDGAARVRFRLSEPGRVTVRIERGSRALERRTVRLRRAGTRRVTLRGLPAGTYRVEVVARDLAGNRAPLRRDRVTVR